MTRDFNRRAWLEGRFTALYVGQFDEMNTLSDGVLEVMVTELEAAQAGGDLNLETEAGIANLKRIVERAIGACGE